jgi:soluble lytic murein transglycosylase-like protein
MASRCSMAFALMTCVAFMGIWSFAEADIFVRTHENGYKEFTNRPSGPGWIFHMTESGYQPMIRFTTKGKPRKLDDIIHDIASEYKIDPALVKAIIKAESNADPQAVSRKGAQGLMQLMPETARELNVKRPFDPKENIIGGVKYIKGLMASYGDLRLALAAYNAGPGTVKKYAGIPPYRETINYVRRVLRYYRDFKKSGKSIVAGS